MSNPSSAPHPRSSLPPLLGAVVALVAFHLVGAVYLDGYALDLGSLNFPTPRFMALTAMWTLFGSVAAVLLATALSRQVRASAIADRMRGEWERLSDGRFLAWTCAAAFAIPVVLRFGLLHRAPLADDESAYRFAAELLASGRLWIPSPPLKLFFDQNFIVNDGRMYPVYFLGWPALLAIGLWVRMPELVNPVLSALTVPPLLWALRAFVGSSWARAGVLLFLSAPFVQIAAATELSHTACLMALAWALWLYLRTTAEDASPRAHAGFAFWLAFAFHVRPQSAVAIGLPLVIAWVANLRHVEARARWRAMAAFAIPAVVLAALFLGTLWAQNGSPWRVGYARYNQYVLENNLRFTTFGSGDVTTAVAGFDYSEVGPAIARTAIGMFRLNVDLFGWPSSFALMVLALPAFARRSRLAWWMAASYVLLMLFQRDWGIDTFGPMHAFELALPVLVLTVIGAKTMAERVDPTFSPALLASLIAVAWLGYVPIRLEAVREIAAQVNVPLRAPERAGLHRAIVFSPLPFVPRCPGVPAHFVFFRPVNDPAFQNDILWANALDPEAERQLLATMPGRTGYEMTWTRECRVNLEPVSR